MYLRAVADIFAVKRFFASSDYKKFEKSRFRGILGSAKLNTTCSSTVIVYYTILAFVLTRISRGEYLIAYSLDVTHAESGDTYCY